MGWATRALILMHLEARPGAWCSAENIAASQQIEPAECEAACVDLVETGLLGVELPVHEPGRPDGDYPPPRYGFFTP